MPSRNPHDSDDEETLDKTAAGKRAPGTNPAWFVVGAVVAVIAGVVVWTKFLSPKVVIPVPAGTPANVQNAIEQLVTASNIDTASRLFNQVASNLKDGRSTTVIVTNVIAPTPAPNPNQPTQPVAGVKPTPVPNNPPTAARGSGPLLELYIMTKKGSIPAATDAPIASLVDDKDLFRASRFKDQPGLAQYQNQNLWLRWRARINVPVTGDQTFFHSINLDRVPGTGSKRSTDFNGRGSQKVHSHVYIDGLKKDSKDRKFSDIQSAWRTSFTVALPAGAHDADIWLGLEAENAAHVVDETSMSLEIRFANQSAPVRPTAAELAR